MSAKTRIALGKPGAAIGNRSGGEVMAMSMDPNVTDIDKAKKP